MGKRTCAVEFKAGAWFDLSLLLLLPLAAYANEAENARPATASPLPPAVAVTEVVQKTVPNLPVATAVSVSPVMGGQICIQADGLEPPVLFVEPETQVEFLNRSGRLVYLAFERRDTDVHPHIPIQTMEAISAVFHEPGPHRYAVHFFAPGMRDLAGTVMVGEHSYKEPDLPVCDGNTVLGGCLER